MIKDESKFWREFKEDTPQISWTRIENSVSLGTPDLLGYNSSGYFFTIELKVSKSNKVRLSPHQIAFHVRHPMSTFILVKDVKNSRLCMYVGRQVKELFACGLSLEPVACGLVDCRLWLESLGSDEVIESA